MHKLPRPYVSAPPPNCGIMRRRAHIDAVIVGVVTAASAQHMQSNEGIERVQQEHQDQLRRPTLIGADLSNCRTLNGSRESRTRLPATCVKGTSGSARPLQCVG
jgi:hypothetical protein